MLLVIALGLCVSTTYSMSLGPYPMEASYKKKHNSLGVTGNQMGETIYSPPVADQSNIRDEVYSPAAYNELQSPLNRVNRMGSVLKNPNGPSWTDSQGIKWHESYIKKRDEESPRTSAYRSDNFMKWLVNYLDLFPMSYTSYSKDNRIPPLFKMIKPSRRVVRPGGYTNQKRSVENSEESGSQELEKRFHLSSHGWGPSGWHNSNSSPGGRHYRSFENYPHLGGPVTFFSSGGWGPSG